MFYSRTWQLWQQILIPWKSEWTQWFTSCRWTKRPAFGINLVFNQLLIDRRSHSFITSTNFWGALWTGEHGITHLLEIQMPSRCMLNLMVQPFPVPCSSLPFLGVTDIPRGKVSSGMHSSGYRSPPLWVLKKHITFSRSEVAGNRELMFK